MIGEQKTSNADNVSIWWRPHVFRFVAAYSRNTLAPHPVWSWAFYQIRKIAGCACAGNAGNVFPRHRLQRKPLVNDPGMHHGTCVTHVPWCISGSLTRGGGENVPGIPGACALATLRIWQEAHGSGVEWGGVTKTNWSPFRYFPNCSVPPNHTLAIEHHIYIWQVSPQLSCGDTCQI